MSEKPTQDDLRDTIKSALELLRGFAPSEATGSAPPLPDLLDECQELIREMDVKGWPPVRTIHHLACTGGTLIARCVGSLPNTQVLSEVDPLSKQAHSGSRFFPTDLVGLAKHSSRPPSNEVLINIFLAGLGVLCEEARCNGFDLVLRDHAHGHFAYGPEIEPRPSLREIIAEAHAVRSIVTVRHPFDSFLSLESHDWQHFKPFTIDEYAKRYHAFLDHYAGLECVRYEDFVADPETQMQRICTVLGLSYSPIFLEIFSTVRLSGDSGRRGDVIAPRSRRAHSEALAREAANSEAFGNLLRRLEYEP